MSSFYSGNLRQQSNVCSYRYPSYLMKVSLPQVCSNVDSNNMLLVPKICHKYYVRKNYNSSMNNIHYVDDLSVKSTVELNDTISMKPTSNKIKMTNKSTDNYTGFNSCSHDTFESSQQPTPGNFRYPSYPMKVSPPQVCLDTEDMLMQNNSKMHGDKKSCSIMMDNSQHYLDTPSKPSSVKLTNLNDSKIKTTNTSIDVNQENDCLTLTTNDLKTKGVMKIGNGINCSFNDCDNQEQFVTKEDIDDVKLFKICIKCHKRRNVDNFDWGKVSKTDKIKLLEIIKQNSKIEKLNNISI